MSEPEALAGRAVGQTRLWLERAVIGLNLCPFAKAVHVKDQVHFAVSLCTEESGLLEVFDCELEALAAADPASRETTLLIAPLLYPEDFVAFNGLLRRCERFIRKRGQEGRFQLASFHPRYRFGDEGQEDITNCTNRSPYPTLHLLREASIDRAVQAFPEADAIYEANMDTMRRLGPDGWRALGVGP